MKLDAVSVLLTIRRYPGIAMVVRCRRFITSGLLCNRFNNERMMYLYPITCDQSCQWSPPHLTFTIVDPVITFNTHSLPTEPDSSANPQSSSEVTVIVNPLSFPRDEELEAILAQTVPLDPKPLEPKPLFPIPTFTYRRFLTPTQSEAEDLIARIDFTVEVRGKISTARENSKILKKLYKLAKKHPSILPRIPTRPKLPTRIAAPRSHNEELVSYPTFLSIEFANPILYHWYHQMLSQLSVSNTSLINTIPQLSV